jgi:hypothetical protein
VCFDGAIKGEAALTGKADRRAVDEEAHARRSGVAGVARDHEARESDRALERDVQEELLVGVRLQAERRVLAVALRQRRRAAAAVISGGSRTHERRKSLARQSHAPVAQGGSHLLERAVEAVIRLRVEALHAAPVD